MTRLLTTVLDALLASAVVFALVTARYPLAAHWNPFAPLDPAAPETPVTPLKLAWAEADVGLCRLALDRGGASAVPISDRTVSDVCHVRDAVRLDRLSTARLAAVEMPCSLALPLLMWEIHDLQPAARDILGSPVARVIHYGAFSCRRIRTMAGPSTRMSAHATAEALDIAGVVTADGRQITLRADYPGDDPPSRFLRAAEAGLCGRFRQVLGPNYNALHADHFHIATVGWPACR